VSGTATPDPAAISLHDYCRLAGESLKMTCAHLDSIAREVAPLLPASADEFIAVASANAASKGSTITEGSLRTYPEKAIAHYLGRHGNVELTAFEQVAAMNSTVLIMGETGTGKELIALAIHQNSKCKDKPMVKINCAALPPTLLESELFGREKGAYTGALSRQAGRFEIADGSTLFLDEIGDLPLELQGKLLRVLESGEFERLGSSKTIRVNVRIIAATNRDLAKAVRAGKFREDLYYRLNVFPIKVPPLRERLEDISILAWALT
jgi:transcriptional regulator with GAF, ATPase, and Fis domain